MFGKLSIRSIPQQVFSALELMASKNDRSNEAEARVALKAWVEPLLDQQDQNTRISEVATRLRSLLGQINCSRLGQPLRPSHIAQRIGESFASDAEDWFMGKTEPSFAQLEAIASILGAAVDWLQHGDGHMFPVTTYRLSEDAGEAVTWLLTDDNTPIQKLHLVRENSENGTLAIIKELGEGKCRTFSTVYHVSKQNGAGGESALAHLWVTLELLFTHYVRAGENIVVASYQMPPKDFLAMIAGDVHPFTALSKSQKTTWWEDVWHRTMSNKKEYWPGSRELCGNIIRAVDSRPHLVKERELIQKNEHPLQIKALA